MLKGSMSLAKVGRHDGKNETSVYRVALKAMYPEHAQVFLHRGLFGTTYLGRPRVF
jgi:hypothetical protein